MTQENMKNTPIFDNYEVECNECGNYWNDTCDGVLPNQKRNCTAFVATRVSDIPKQIKSLDRSVDKLKGSILILFAIDILLAVVLLS